MKGTWRETRGETKRRRDEETKKEALVGEAFIRTRGVFLTMTILTCMCIELSFFYINNR